MDEMWKDGDREGGRKVDQKNGKDVKMWEGRDGGEGATRKGMRHRRK